MKLRSLIVASFAALSSLAYGATINVPSQITDSTTWTADNEYILDGYTFVITPSGAASPTVLTIEPGTVIKAVESSGAGAAALVITRGAKIHASGTKNEPIIFTSELDNLNGNLGPTDTALWGGVVILGNAVINSRSDGGALSNPVEDQVEGFDLAAGDLPFITFGGTDDADNSGVLRYVSIRHGGAVIGTANEINGLTLGGVGSGTTIEYIEVFANKDDGIEWFGGTVDVKYAAAVFGNDDGFDYDQGWRGRGQFWFVLQTDITSDRGDKGGEHDGSTSPADATPIGGTTVFNATFIGIGDAGADNTALNIRDNAIAKYYNSIFTDYAKMLNIEADNQDRFDAGDVDFSNNIWWSHIGANNNAAGLTDGDIDASGFWTDAAKNNLITDPLLGGISRTTDGGLDPRPITGAALSGAATVPDDGFFVQTTYKGAFSADTNWLDGWTKLSQDGYLPTESSSISKVPMVATSNRANIGTGEEVQIAGFVLTGDEPQTILIRGLGPELENQGVVGVSPDPSIALFRAGVNTPIISNDNWSADENEAIVLAAAAKQVGAPPLTAGSTDAAMLVTIEPGVYTVIADGEPGVALVETFLVR